MDPNERAVILSELITLRLPLEEAVARVRALPWDSDDELVVLDRSAALSALMNYRSGDLDPEQFEMWAETIEGREDIGFEAGYEELLSQFVFESANPLLTQDLRSSRASVWIERLKPTA